VAFAVEWTRAGFEQLGFVGWKAFNALEARDLPPRHGVYVLVREPGPRPEFLMESVGGPHKRKPLTVDVDVLEKAWRDDAEVVYVGKAGSRLGLQERLWAYAKQGRGRSAGHAGGRFVWQLPASDELLVGWRETEGVDVGDVEEALLALHIEQFGRRPFANMKDGHSMTPDQARLLLAKVFAGPAAP
jgi:hypothetical protein